MSFRVNYADYAKRLSRPLNDEVRIQPPEQNVVTRKVRSLMAHPRCFGKLSKGRIELFEQPIGGGETVFRDELPDLLEVRKGASRLFELLHVRCPQRSSL